MKPAIFLLAFLRTAAAFIPEHGGRPDFYTHHPTVSTTSGYVRGKVDPTLPNVAQYLGIPYAAPPVGQLRWAPPQPLVQPHAYIDATELPVSCMQFLSIGATFAFTAVSEFNLQGLNRTGAISEDCLTLSVWAPANATSGHGWHGHRGDGEGLPVLIFINGGGFYDGGTDTPYDIPAQWVNRTPDHIVVTFNFRMGIFGEPNAAGLEEQNLWLLDIRMLLEWCKQNIAAFGGDPSKMAMFGQSSSAMSIDYYNFAYPDNPIVSGLIMESGTALTPFLIDDLTHSNFTFVAENVGCSGMANDPGQQLSCIRSVDANTIEDFVGAYTNNGTQPFLAFTPVMDDRMVFHNYTERALAGQQSKIPAIIGTNTGDGVAFALGANGLPDQTVASQWQLTLFDCPATETIRLRQETGRLSYRYLYAGNFSNVSPKPWMGAIHGAEIPIIMGTHPNYRGNSTELEYTTSDAFQDAYVAFAKDPVNGLAGLGWKTYAQLGTEQVREFGDRVAVQDISIAAREAFCDGAAPVSMG